MPYKHKKNYYVKDADSIESINCCQLETHKALIRERQAARYEKPPIDIFSKRTCTDIFCLFIFVAAVIAWVVILALVFFNGGFEKVIAPVDSNNRRCGFDNGVQDKSNLFFFDITKCLLPRTNFLSCDTKQVCVAECPKVNFSYSYYIDNRVRLRALKDKLICVDEFDKESEIRSYDDVENAVRKGLCADWYMESEQTLGLCLPRMAFPGSDKTDLPATVTLPEGVLVELKGVTYKLLRSGASFAKTSEEFIHNVGETLLNTWRWIVAFLCLALFLSFIYIIIMRWISGLIVWMSLITLLGLLIFSSIYTWNKYTEAKKEKSAFKNFNLTVFVTLGQGARQLEDDIIKHENTWLTFFIFSVVSLALTSIILLFLRKRIKLAIKLIKEGSRAVSCAWSSLIFPVFPWILQLWVLIHAAYIFCFLIGEKVPVYRATGLNGSSCLCSVPYKERRDMDGDVCDIEAFKTHCHEPNGDTCKTASCTFAESEASSYTIYVHLYNIFMFLWCEYFISGFSEMSLGMTFSTWYWNPLKSKLPCCIVGTSVLRVLTYHMGTVAFGSLLLALLNWLKVIVHFCYKYVNYKGASATLRCFRCCCGCILAFLHSVLRILTKNAYIVCAMKGTNYCTSARQAFDLIVKNIVRAAVLDRVTTYLFFLMKFLLTGFITGLAYWFFSSPIPEVQKILAEGQFEPEYSFAPVVIIALVTFMMASLFFGVYSTAVSTIFLCALEDLDQNDGSPSKPYVMSKRLIKIFKVKNRTASETSRT